MNILKLIIILIQAVLIHSYTKTIRIDCKSSGKYTKISNCRVRPINSTTNIVEYSFEVLKPVSQVLVSYNMSVKNLSPYWRHIVEFKKIDLCLASRGASLIPTVNDFKKMIERIIPNTPTKCPVTPRNISLKVVKTHGSKNDELNKTADDYRKNKQFFAPLITPTLFPNGLIRQIINFWNDEDSDLLTISWVSDHYIRMNDDKF